MPVSPLRTLVLRHRGVLLAAMVVLLAAVAALLAANVLHRARDLAAQGAPASASLTPAASHDHSPQGTTASAEPSESPAVSATPKATPAPTPGPIAGWQLAGTFGEGESMMGVHDLAAWNGGFVALGESWEYDDLGGTPKPRMWRSADGSAWTEVPLDLGRGASVQVLAPLEDGSLMLLGTTGGNASYWSEPARASAWTSRDAVSWSPVPVPFGEEVVAGPVGFAAGGRGLVATVDDTIWHSADGRSWRSVYDAPRGSWVYGAVAGDEGWIVRQGSASLGTTVLLVSGDAVNWHEVDLGHVATVSSVAGDWLASRHTPDWTGTEILRSANGLDWDVVLDLAMLPTPPDGDATLGGYDGATLTGTADMLFLSPWQVGHCMSMPAGDEVWWSRDGARWVPAGLNDGAVVTHATGEAGMSVLAGYLVETGGVAFWTSAP